MIYLSIYLLFILCSPEPYATNIHYSTKFVLIINYISDHLWPKLRVSKEGDLEIIGVIDEGTYYFNIVAEDFGPNSSTVLKARAKVANTFIVISKNVRMYSRNAWYKYMGRHVRCVDVGTR